MVNAFNAFKSSSEAIKSADKYRDVPFTQMLDDAKKGDKEAFLYAILNSLGPLHKVFVSYFVRGKSVPSQTIDELSHDYFNSLLVYLYELNDRQKGPFFKFNPSMFSDTDEDFLMNKLRYYFYRYAQVLARKLTGSSREINTTEVTPPAMDNDDFFSTVEAQPERDSALTGQEEFVHWLTIKKPKLAKILLLLNDNMKPRDIMKAVGINTREMYSRAVKAIAEYYQQFLLTKGEAA